MSLLPIVKYCGFTNKEEIEELEGLGVNMAGFIFAPSRRRVPLDKWKELVAAVPAGVKKVGVFVDPSFGEIVDVFSKAPLDVVQLHGKETPEFCERVRNTFCVELIKAWHVGLSSTDNALCELNAYKGSIDYLLLDTYDPKEAGGTGKTFGWDQLPKFHAWCEQSGIRLIVAGGLRVENILELLNYWPLHGIDVSSGIETNGSKDKFKMRELSERVRGNVRNT